MPKSVKPLSHVPTQEEIDAYRAQYSPRLRVVREVVDYIVPSRWVIRPHTGAKPGWVELVYYTSDGTRSHGVEFTPEQARLVGEALIACAEENSEDLAPPPIQAEDTSL